MAEDPAAWIPDWLKEKRARVAALPIDEVPAIAPEDVNPGDDECGLLGWVINAQDLEKARRLLAEVRLDDLQDGRAKKVFRCLADLATRSEQVIPEMWEVIRALITRGDTEEEARYLTLRCVKAAFLPQVVDQTIKRIRSRARSKRLLQSVQAASWRLMDGADCEEVRTGLLRELQEEVTPRRSVTLNAALDAEAERIGARQRIRVMHSGLHELDDAAGGLEVGQVGVIAGESGSGKTALALQMARYAANEYGSGLVVSLEMMEDQLARRVLAGLTGVDYRDLRNAGRGRDIEPFNELELEYLRSAVNRGKTMYDLHIETNTFRVSELVSAVHSYHSEQKIEWVMIDYGQLLTEDRRRAQSKAEEMGAVAKALKNELATPLRIPVWVLLQPTQEATRRGAPLRVSDLAWSAVWRESATQIWLLYPTADAPPREDNGSASTLEIAKSRNGALGKIPLVFYKPMFEFAAEPVPLPDDEQAPPERRFS